MPRSQPGQSILRGVGYSGHEDNLEIVMLVGISTPPADGAESPGATLEASRGEAIFQ